LLVRPKNNYVCTVYRVLSIAEIVFKIFELTHEILHIAYGVVLKLHVKIHFKKN